MKWYAFPVGAAVFCMLMVMNGCGDHDHDHSHDHSSTSPEAAVETPTNRVAVNEQVRRNLGITFAKAQYRVVTSTLRVPGRFVALPQGERHYHGPVRGRVSPLVSAFQEVAVGTPLYELDAPAWRTLQGELAERAAAVARTQADISIALAERAQAERMLTSLTATIPVHEQRAKALQAAVTHWQERVTTLEQLQQAGGGRASELADARAQLIAAQSTQAEAAEHQAEHLLEHARVDAALNRQGDAPARLHALLAAARAEADAAEAAYATALQRASALSGFSVEALLESVDVELGQVLTPDSGKIPRWRAIDRLTVKADRVGIIASINVVAGAWIEETSEVMTLIDPTQVRFEGTVLQSDLPRVRAGMKVNIRAPAPAAPDVSVRGQLSLSPQIDPVSRTVAIAVVPEDSAVWARPGVGTVAEIALKGGDEELAIPLAAVVRDDLNSVIFRRAPDNPDEVIRLTADLGTDDGTWVVIESGLKEGDEVVLDGAYELVLGSGGKAKGGHFHADGTFHAEDH